MWKHLALCAAMTAGTVAPAMADQVHETQIREHLTVGNFDRVPPRREYYGHFLHGQVHHGAAIHGGGHLNAEGRYSARGTLIRSGDGRTFNVLVTPNLVNRASAKSVADMVALNHCRGVSGANSVVYDRVQRHSAADLASWSFAGHCR